MKRTHARFSLFLWLLAAALPLMAGEKAIRSGEGFATIGKIVKRIELAPTADSELQLNEAALVDLEDGSRRLRFAYQLEGREERFFAKVDLAAGTYTAYRADSSAIPAAVRERSAEKAQKNRARLDLATDTIYDPPPNCGLPSGPQFDPCESPCSGNSNAVLTWYDNSWNWLADTEGNLNYKRFGARGCRWFNTMLGACNANSNAAGKVWYTQSCTIQNAPPFINGASGSIEGKYYNTNGGNQNLTTNARHKLQIDYAAPATWVYYEYNMTGEIYTTFHIEFFSWVNGYCFPY